jgi:hypothetical protein
MRLIPKETVSSFAALKVSHEKNTYRAVLAKHVQNVPQAS